MMKLVSEQIAEELADRLAFRLSRADHKVLAGMIVRLLHLENRTLTDDELLRKFMLLLARELADVERGLVARRS